MSIVFIGEAGSGKTEIALNTAAALAERRDKKIVLIDMDQTKAIFRLREKADVIANEFTTVKWGQQLLDTPVTPSGIREAILDSSQICILDVGGNVAGAIQLGQFSQELKETESKIYYCINPYRPFTQGKELQGRIAKVKRAAGIETVSFICNPNFGSETKAEDIIEGIGETEKALESIGCRIEKVAVTERYYEELKEDIPYEVMKLKRYIFM